MEHENYLLSFWTCCSTLIAFYVLYHPCLVVQYIVFLCNKYMYSCQFNNLCPFLSIFQLRVLWGSSVERVPNTSPVMPILHDTCEYTPEKSHTPVQYVVKAAVRKLTWKPTCLAFTWKTWIFSHFELSY